MFRDYDEILNTFLSHIKKVKQFITLYDDLQNINIKKLKHSKYYKKLKEYELYYKSQVADTKIVHYNAIIISLYGILELTIKEVSKHHARILINQNSVYIKNFKKENISSIAKNLDRLHGVDLKSDVENLYKMIVLNDNSGINLDYIFNKNNLKTKEVRRICSILGIQNIDQKIKNSYDFIKLYQMLENIKDFNKAKTTLNRLDNPFEKIDHIVDSRNKIAHEGYDPNMIGLNELSTIYIPQLELYVKLLVKFLKIEVLKEKYKLNHLKQLSIIKVINNNIICFNSKDVEISKNSILLLISSKGLYDIANIENIELNNTSIDVVPQHTDIGCKITTRCKDNYKIFIY